MIDPRLTALAASLPATVPFVGPEAQERASGRPFAARLGANENGFGPSPRAVAAMAQAAAGAWRYGDPENHDLRHALAAHHGIDPANIVVGEGIDALLGYVVRLTVGPGSVAVTSAGAYPTFDYHVAGYGGRLVHVAMRDDHADPDALLEAARSSGARLIYLSNPDNPMGTRHPAPAIAAMVAAVPDAALLILDEAYVELAPDGTAPPLDPAEGRVLRMRTFSKVYGMAGARIGYAIGCAPLIAAFDRVRLHFGVNRIAQAGALAALADRDWLCAVVARIADSRRQIGEIARGCGLAPVASATNFVTVDCGRDGAFARAVMAGLLTRGVFVRKPAVAPQDRCIRIGAGPAPDMALLAAALPAALAEALEAPCRT